jgi:GNAT superfamily N-acetyltransferase
MQAFIRIFWADGDDYDIDYGLREEAFHVLLAIGNALISYAGVVSVHIQHAGITYTCFGLSSVMTFPAFRKRGYGGHVVEVATSLIHQDTSADIALLWTPHPNEHFYARHGWQAMPHMTILVGDPAHPTVKDDELPMMLFLSDKGKQGRSDFEHSRVYIGEIGW